MGGIVCDSNLEDKIQQAKEVLAEKTTIFGNSVAIVFTGSKETTVILDLMKESHNGKILSPVVHIDSGLETIELYDYRKAIQKSWDFKVKIFKRHDSLSPDDIAVDTTNCCRKIKAEGLNEAVKQYAWKAVMLDIRDSGYEEISKFGIPILNPVAHFNELDFWRYIKQRGLPYCSLYSKGFRLIACEPCLRPWLRKIEPSEENKEEVISRLKSLGYF